MEAGKPQSYLGGSASCHILLGALCREIWPHKPGKVKRKTEHKRPEGFGHHFADNGGTREDLGEREKCVKMIL